MGIRFYLKKLCQKIIKLERNRLALQVNQFFESFSFPLLAAH
jgi:hypothetical protein